MHPSTDMPKHGLVPKMFHKIVEKFSIVKIDSGPFSTMKMLNDYLHAQTISDVKASLKGISKVVDFTKSTPKLFAVFAFSLVGHPLGTSKHNIHTIANLAMFGHLNSNENLMEERNGEEPTRAPTIPISML